jgi:hypothetical protein
LLAVPLLSLADAGAQTRPDFTGDWILNRVASALQGESTAVESSVIRIDHRDPAFTFKRTFVVKGQSLDASYAIQTEGREDHNVWIYDRK